MTRLTLFLLVLLLTVTNNSSVGSRSVRGRFAVGFRRLCEPKHSGATLEVDREPTLFIITEAAFSYDNSVSLQTDDAGHVGAAVSVHVACVVDLQTNDVLRN